MARASGFRSAEAREAYVRLYDEAVASAPVPVEQSDVPTSYGTTHVLTAGDPAKPPLVALHGKALSSTNWLPLLPTLTATHHVRMLDAPGDLGKSVATRVLNRPRKVVEWLDQALGELGVERAAFAAISIGTWMSVHYAMEHPGRVERMAMICPAGIVSRLDPRWLVGALAAALHPTPEKARKLLDTMAVPAARHRLREDPWRPVVDQFAQGTAAFRLRIDEAKPAPCDIGRLAAARIPTLVVIGREETLHDGALMARRFREQLPHARVELVDDANHLVFVDRQELVEELLGDFLAEPAVAEA